MTDKKDKEPEDIYRVVGIELPMRVKNDTKNRLNWRKAAQSLEATMNEMHRAGMRASIITDFSMHGMLVIGQRPPPMPKTIRTPFGDIPVPTPGEPTGESADPSEMLSSTGDMMAGLVFQRIINTLTAMPNSPSDEQLKSLVNTAVPPMPAEALRKVVLLCEVSASEHTDHSCQIAPDLARVKKLLDERIQHNEN